VWLVSFLSNGRVAPTGRTVAEELLVLAPNKPSYNTHLLHLKKKKGKKKVGREEELSARAQVRKGKEKSDPRMQQHFNFGQI
jgi:hypothetical protein